MTLSARGTVPLPAAWFASAGGAFRAHHHAPHSSRLSTLCVSLALLLLVFIGESSAQLDPVKNFCRRFGHQTAVIDRKLYIDGGFVNYNPLSQYPTNYSNTGLDYHDLDTLGAARMPQLYANLTKNSTIPSVSGGTLWADDVNKRFYLFGGEYYQQPPSPQFTLWSYDTLYNTWDSFGSPAQDDIAAVSWGAGLSISETGEGYYFGGWKSNNTMPGYTGPPVAVSQLVKYSMDSNSWSTETGPDSIGRAEGSMVFIPIGDGGMLVYFGGVQDPHNNGSWIGQPMETILLYDVLSSKWYTQNATGTIPGMRSRFCAGATWATDQSSYNIYLYGGAGMPPDTAGFDDVYVLTIPSFEWIKMFPTDGNITGPYPHHSLSCNVVDYQMIVIGGTFPTTDICDAPEQWGLHNIDMGEQNQEKALWEFFVTNLTQYVVPDPIVSVIGGSATGGATKTAPASGFNNPDLSVLMTRKASLPTRTATRAIPTATGTPGQDSTTSKPLSTGAIAGIAVGGAIALLALVTICCFLVRRRRYRRHHSRSQPGKPLSQSPHNWSPHPSSAGPYTPNHQHNHTNSHPNSPFLPNHHPQNRNHFNPAELPAASAGGFSPPPLDTVPDGGVKGGPWPGLSDNGGGSYEMVHQQQHHHQNSYHNDAPVPQQQQQHHQYLSASSTTDPGTGSMSNSSGDGTEPQTKVDAEGRLWVQISPGPWGGAGGVAGRGGGGGGGGLGREGRRRGGGGGEGGGSGGGSSSGGSAGLLTAGELGRHYHYAGGSGEQHHRYSPVVTPGGLHQQQHRQEMTGPQELSTEPRGVGSWWGTEEDEDGEEEMEEEEDDRVLGERAGWDGAHGRPRHLTFYHP